MFCLKTKISHARPRVKARVCEKGHARIFDQLSDLLSLAKYCLSGIYGFVEDGYAFLLGFNN